MVEISPSVAALLNLFDRLPAAEREAARTAINTARGVDLVLGALDGLVGPDRRCPHCQQPGAQKRGVVSGLTRYACRSCGKSFNALTGTPLARLRKKECWLAMTASLAQAETVRKTAASCDVAASTAFRWRHRMLGTTAKRKAGIKLANIVEADIAFVRHSEKGSRCLTGGRKARRRGGPKGEGADMLAILMGVERGADMLAEVLRGETAGAIRYAVKDVLQRGATIITDSARNFARVFRKMGVHHETVNIAKKQRVRGAFHVQTINAVHHHFRDFMARFKGVATKYLPNYFEWYRTICHHRANTRFSCFNAVLDGAAMSRA